MLWYLLWVPLLTSVEQLNFIQTCPVSRIVLARKNMYA
jgi:hypothetical protein